MSIDSISNSGINPIQQSLTSGSSINRSADNAAGQAVVTALTTQINQQDMATQNLNDGVSLIQTADGASESIAAQIQRLSELSIQAQNGTYSDAQRNILNTEFQQGLQSINQHASQANFNGTTLLDGSTSTLDIATGEGTQTLDLPDLTSSGLSLDGLDITSAANANSALGSLQDALKTLSDGRSQFGAQQNGLTASIHNQATQTVNAQSSRSQINDTDYAKAVMELTRQQVLDQSGIAMQTQRNQDKSQVLQLLQG